MQVLALQASFPSSIEGGVSLIGANSDLACRIDEDLRFSAMLLEFSGLVATPPVCPWISHQYIRYPIEKPGCSYLRTETMTTIECMSFRYAIRSRTIPDCDLSGKTFQHGYAWVPVVFTNHLLRLGYKQRCLLC